MCSATRRIPKRVAESRFVTKRRWDEGLTWHVESGTVRDQAGRGALAVLMLIPIVVVAALLGIPRLSINDDFVKYFDKSFEFRRAAEFSQQYMTGPNYIDLQISSGQADGIYDPKYIVLLNDLTQWLRGQPLIASAVSLAMPACSRSQ